MSPLAGAKPPTPGGRVSRSLRPHRPMQYTIHTQRTDRHNDWVQAHDGYRTPRKGRGDKQTRANTEDDGHPVIVMESGVELDEDGSHKRTRYHEQRAIRGPAQSWDEAKEAARVGDDEWISEEGLSGLQPGNPDYYAVEVMKPVDA